MPISTETVLSVEQEAAISFILQHLEAGVVALAGPAGSGKTTLIKELAKRIEGTVTIAATTAKAAHVLRKKGLEDAVTFHSACLRPIFDHPLDRLQGFLEQLPDEGKEMKYPEKLVEEFTVPVLTGAYRTTQKTGIYSGMRELGIRDAMKYVSGWIEALPQEGTLIIDEASMMGDKDLEAAQKVYSRIILVGDEYQLPPVKAAPAFWKVPIRFRLTEVHRQAENSQPLTLATSIRNGEKVVASPVSTIDAKACFEGSPVLVWMNITRTSLTKTIREKLGFKNLGPQPGETLICRNASDRAAKFEGFFNNSTWTVVSADGYECLLRNEDGKEIEQDVHMEEQNKGHGIPFRFAYVLTAHNAQGSEWESVQIHKPDAAYFFKKDPKDARRWAYTCVTRAKKKVIWVNDNVV